MTDFQRGICVWIMIFISAISIVEIIARMTVYQNMRNDQYMTWCQQQGYTWGTCYNTIIGTATKFDK